MGHGLLPHWKQLLFFPFIFFSFVFFANSTSRVISPSGENQEAMRKLGTISSFISSKELEKEVCGRKDVKFDKNLRDSWKYSREQGWEARSKWSTAAADMDEGRQSLTHGTR